MAATIQFFLQLRNQLKLYHWQTRVFARHMATDKILEELDESIDKYVEVMIGKMGTRPKLMGDNAVIRLQNLTEAGATRMVRAAMKYLQGPLTRTLRPTDTDLINIRDEIMGQLDQLLYLFSLH